MTRSASLGNFLSGMETDPPVDSALTYGDLGNFLSGMETRAPGVGRR